MPTIQINILASTTGRYNVEQKNTSLQNGDSAFYQQINNNDPIPTADNPIYIGTITDVGETYIKVESSLDPANITGFLMFSKNKLINNSSLNGYYADVTFRNNDVNNKAEIFAINSEVSQSSK
tara:strand:- start:622 stop:990 length:369 start_codon:yes stop_codon:yes gene_type:complete